MPNNLIFNGTADQLKTKLYGDNNGTTTAIAVNANGNLTVIVETITEVTNVSSVDTVDQVTNVASVDTVDVVSAVTTVTQVNNISSVDTIDQITNVASVDTIDALTQIINTVNVDVVANGFAENVATIANYNFTTETTTLSVDTSAKTLYSFYVKNTGASTVTAKLQISPTTTAADFIDDPGGDTATLAPSTGKDVLATQRYLKYTRLHLSGTGTSTIFAYYNAHN
ncbi:MAG: DUF6385 domain-containing protein [Bacillota bacterium]